MAGCDHVVDPVTFIDRLPRVAIPELTWSPSDPAALYSRQLTHLEICVCHLLAEGYDVRAIAVKRRIRQGHVRLLVHSILRKLEIPSRYALVRAWQCDLFHVGLLALGLVPYPTRKRK